MRYSHLTNNQMKCERMIDQTAIELMFVMLYREKRLDEFCSKQHPNHAADFDTNDGTDTREVSTPATLRYCSTE